MADNRGDRFLRTTRGRIILLLRRKSRTVNELAQSLSVTDNAVRAQLAILERDGLVVDSGTVPGARKPHVVYSATAQANQLFPRAYEPLTRELLSVLARKLSPRRMDGLMHAVGKRLATAFNAPPPDANIRQRVKAAVDVLGELGGLAEIEEEEGKLVIRGFSCPLQSAVAAYPGACRLAETLLSEIVGAPVRERCDKGPSPRCCFEILPNR